MAAIVNKYAQAQNAITKASSILVERAAQSHVAVAKQLAPVDTGYMRDHIKSEPINDTATRVVSEANYSLYVEFGTTYSEAQPFFYPAYESAQRQLREEAGQVIAAQLVAAGLR